ncbi:hypothetical protein DYB32_009370 [Aphanomyces invadans]|uniref:Retrovirus-related Pol polyprotein from transposon TNT 1-94-like beta-barrel domain-containing protein n=1 Tax=Aphanomyces invadans TaxID=157072 RepID=A0A418AIK3_9STRA|nr:hypothetical protein DYB32_009370 [Aphanomyces invadans]
MKKNNESARASGVAEDMTEKDALMDDLIAAYDDDKEEEARRAIESTQALEQNGSMGAKAKKMAKLSYAADVEPVIEYGIGFTHRSAVYEHRIVIDSGASTHMTGAAEHLYAKTPCNRQVIVANGGVTPATLMGELNISTPTPSTLTLTDVLLIKGMTTTLLSVPALIRANPKVRVEFQRDTCTILLGSKTVARATISNDQRLYILEGVFTDESANSAATVADQTALWHHRIGQLPVEAFRTCAKAGLGLPQRITDMDRPRMDCPRAKMHRITVLKRSTRTY